MKLVDIDSENLGIPDVEYTAAVTMSSVSFQRIMRDLSTIGDTVKISVTKEFVKFSVVGDVASGNVVCRNDSSDDDSGQKTMIDLVEPVCMTFALKYINLFAKATPLSVSVKLSLTLEFPLVTEYRIGDGMGSIRYYLASQVEHGE